MADLSSTSLPYHEPSIVTILIQSSFLLLLNTINSVLDKTLYCGLLGQVFLGVAWGAPGAKWLGLETQETIVQLGYLGLILLVYEGGLSTNFSSLRANLVLSTAVAITGISVPIGLSFSLQGLAGATPLQAFAAGAALCSTSLGTTFTVLSTSGLTTTRLGVVLTSAAMMDDVVGLVMVQVISNLGGSSGTISAATVVRPILVSLAFAVAVPVACRFVVKPLTVWLNGHRQGNKSGFMHRTLSRTQIAFAIHTLLLLGLVTGASYAGTSNLFAAYLAGAAISWWDEKVPHLCIQSTRGNDRRSLSEAGGSRLTPTKQSQPADTNQSQNTVEAEATAPTNSAEAISHDSNRPVGRPLTGDISNGSSGVAVYEVYYQQAVDRVLKPLFFASIGFSIPITRMFTGPVLWRGIVYTILMAFAKLVCGIWLIRLSPPPSKLLKHARTKLQIPRIAHFWGQSSDPTKTTSPQPQKPTQTSARSIDPPESQPATELLSTLFASTNTTTATTSPPAPEPSAHQARLRSANPAKPRSLYPAAILGGAMVARGEIGFLISSIAETNGIFAPSEGGGDSDVFLVVTWAIVLCTVLGPLCVGLLVRRVKRLEGTREGGHGDVLGVWGVR
ncbi:hypothetical protein H2201_006373 [Coniosporium apollinis]|uniref:Cation/H+ exchanger transmembrane domain-containing protein n=1 Tax=Coniosporium apollinis TaxID=61459 RepID=A0ABQ9NS70_9PEZI|nr:hypothetical protein H2201_006373 [Coniosporium apollinis]